MNTSRRRSHPALALIVLACGMTGAFAADPLPGDAAARSFATLAMSGVEYALRKDDTSPDSVATKLACIDKLKVTRVAPIFAAFLRERFAEDELRAIDAFHDSSLGAKVNQLGIGQFYRSKGEAPPQPDPVLTPADHAEMTAFSESAAGKRYASENVFASDEVKQKLSVEIAAVIEHCFKAPTP